MEGIEMVALTDVAIRNAKPGPKPYKLGDSHGLFLLIQPTDGKLWRLKYRVDGREKKLAIGPYPEIGLGEARRRRDEAREAMAAGKDPAREKQRDKVHAAYHRGAHWKERVAMAQWCSDYLDDLRKGAKSV